MAGWGPILQWIIRERIGAPAPSVTRQPLPSAAIKPAVRNEKIQSGRDGSLMPAGKDCCPLGPPRVQALSRPPTRGDRRDRWDVQLEPRDRLSGPARDPERANAVPHDFRNRARRGHVPPRRPRMVRRIFAPSQPTRCRGLWPLTQMIPRWSSSGSTTATSSQGRAVRLGALPQSKRGDSEEALFALPGDLKLFFCLERLLRWCVGGSLLCGIPAPTTLMARRSQGP
jgi:hypothetical protein